MQVDIIVNEYDSPSALAEQAALAESYGIRALWSTSYATGRDPFLSLAQAAQSTRRILLGPLAVSPMELHPLKITQELLTLNELCNGRAIIAVGAGGGVLAAMGVKRNKMVESVRECVEIIRAALTGEDVDYHGEIYTAHQFDARWAKDQPPPQIYVGASQERMSYMATEKADGLMGSDLIPPLIRLTRKWVDEGLVQNGRTGQSFGVSNFWAWHIKKDKDAARREACRELVLRGILRPRYTELLLSKEDSDFVQENKGWFWHAFATGAGTIDGVPARIVDALIDGLSSTGDLDDIDREIERFKEYASLGLTEIALRVHGDPVEAIKLIGERIVPALVSETRGV
jgi:5,10-methylenetetrahydromethanopterin reductase